MTPSLLDVLFSELWSDLQNVKLLWQIGVLVACLAAGWGMARLVRGAFVMSATQQTVLRLGVSSFYHVLSPLIALALVAIARPVMAHWFPVPLLRVAIPLIGSFALIRLTFYMLRRAFVRSGNVGNFLRTFERGFAALVWLGLAIYLTGLWPDVVQFLEETVLPLGDKNKVSLSDILQALIFVAITLIFALWVGATLEDRLMSVDGMHSSMRVVLARMGRAVLILIAVLVSLSLVGIDLTVLSVFGGALGVGIGLGLQKIVSSYVSGFVILLERSLAIGNMVTVDKYTGIVTQINTRYTVLRGLDGIESVVPNEMLVAGAIQNYSLTDRSLRLATQVTVDYQTNIDQLFPLLEQAVAAVPRILQEPPPGALLLKFGADGLELDIGFWIADPENGRLSVVSEVNRRVWQVLQEQHVKVPYPQREMRVLNDFALPQAENTPQNAVVTGSKP